MKKIQFITYENDKPKINQIELSDHDFSLLSNAKKALSRVLNHEELYDQVIESYVDAKSAMYEMSVRSISDGISYDYIKNHNCRSKLNRLYFNTLNLSKLYLDCHYREHRDKQGAISRITCFVESITNSENDVHEINMQRTDIFARNHDYILGCELRNFVQHASLPVETFTSGVRYSPEDNQAFAVFHIPLDKQVLIDGGVKKSRLSKYGDKIDLHEVMDGYIYAISEMHLKSRSLIEKCVDKSESFIDLKRREIELKYDNLQYGIEVIDSDNGDRLFSLHLEWFSVVKHLKNKNSHAINFKRFCHEPYQKK